jgi:hypothetical protein
MSRWLVSRVRLAAGCLAVVAIAAAAQAVPAAASAATGHNPRGRLLGAAQATRSGSLQARLHAASASPMTYHGGPVVHDGHVYAIFWEPPGYTFPSGYKAAIARYFTDAAADSGKRTNVYSVNRQYSDATGPALYKVAFAGSYTDTGALPVSGCTNPQTAVCLTDDELTAELGRFVWLSGLPTGLTRQYFIFTPPGVGSCFDGSSDPCVYADYCAYHSFFSTSAGVVLYAVHPYVTGVGTCDVGESPTGTGADAVLNVVSHEHNEIITDPTGTGWFDADGDENGDKCAWTFGGLQGPLGQRFNQVVGGSDYLLQLEWSNSRAGCAANAYNLPPSAFFVQTGKRVARKPVHFDASAASDRDGRIASYAWRFGDGSKAFGKLAAHTYAHAGTYRVRLTVIDDEGYSATRGLDVQVAPQPRHRRKRTSTPRTAQAGY